MRDDERVTAHLPDLSEHRRTYRWFVRAALIFAGHCLVILDILGWWYTS
jgi:hypothetical protein